MKINSSILSAMFAELEKAPRIYRPSPYWEKLNRRHAERIAASGLSSFKRSVNLKYFNWRIKPILRQQLWPVLAELGRLNFSPFIASEFGNYGERLEEGAKGFRPWSAFVYRSFIASFADYVRRRDSLRLLEAAEEPLAGNPFAVRYRGRLISQDLLNSILEFYSATAAADLKQDIKSVVEIGAGYGRLAYVFLKALPRTSYTIIDVPPALYIAQEYLAELFPSESIFRFRPFHSFEEVRNEFETSRIRFLMSHQVELLPGKSADLVLNVSSFQEMDRDQIANYTRQLERIGRKFFYTKQWKRSIVKDNDFITEREYPAPAGWRKIYHRRHPIQRLFFETLYEYQPSRH